MMREMMPLRDAISRFADMHEAERDRLKVWAAEVAPQIAAELGIPVDQLRPVIDEHLTGHLATFGEMIEQDVAEMIASAEPEASEQTTQPSLKPAIQPVLNEMPSKEP